MHDCLAGYCAHIDADKNSGIPWVRFWHETETNGRTERADVRTCTHQWDQPNTNDQGEMRAVVLPGKRRFGVGYEILRVGYKLDDGNDTEGRELELPGGKTVTATFMLRRKR